MLLACRGECSPGGLVVRKNFLKFCNVVGRLTRFIFKPKSEKICQVGARLASPAPHDSNATGRARPAPTENVYAHEYITSVGILCDTLCIVSHGQNTSNCNKKMVRRFAVLCTWLCINKKSPIFGGKSSSCDTMHNVSHKMPTEVLYS